MKKILFVIGLAISTPVFASVGSEEVCQSAIVATGKDSGYAHGYCRNTQYSEETWRCILKYTLSGHDVDFAKGACSSVETSNSGYVKKGALVCLNRDAMRGKLGSKMSYKLAKMKYGYDTYKNDPNSPCFLTEGGKVQIINKFSGEKYTNKQYNETYTLFDYFAIKNGHKTSYVRSSEVTFK